MRRIIRKTNDPRDELVEMNRPKNVLRRIIRTPFLLIFYIHWINKLAIDLLFSYHAQFSLKVSSSRPTTFILCSYHFGKRCYLFKKQCSKQWYQIIYNKFANIIANFCSNNTFRFRLLENKHFATLIYRMIKC